MKSSFIRHLKQKYPSLGIEDFEHSISENLLCPHVLQLPKSVLSQAQQFVKAAFHLRSQPEYLAHYQTQLEQKNLKDPGNNAIMMSYDFHLDSAQDLKLIEINTNAAFLGLGAEFYESQNLSPQTGFTTADIRLCIEQELRQQGKQVPAHLNIVITDEGPSEQKLFAEFLLFNEAFKSWGWQSRIVDTRDLSQGEKTPDFVYNRNTDFFFESESTRLLKTWFESRESCISPNPFEYYLLADKQRLIDWRSPGFLERMNLTPQNIETILRGVPLCYDSKTSSTEEIWAHRKNLFFKPKNAYGSKQSYRGSSISRKTFDALFVEDVIAQEYIPAPEIEYETPEGLQKFKYDLRCYAYRDQLQLVIARVYQGQVTNLKSPYGGFALVHFVESP